MHGICHAYIKRYLGYTWESAKLGYTMYILFKFSGYTVQNSLIYIVYSWYSMHISSIYIIYDIKNLPCPCTCHVQLHLDSAVALALFPTQRESPVCL